MEREVSRLLGASQSAGPADDPLSPCLACRLHFSTPHEINPQNVRNPMKAFGRGARTAAAALLVAASLSVAPGAVAQAPRVALTGAVDEATRATEPNALERGRYAIVVDLDHNVLSFKQGDLTLWTAPVGTGTGMRMITHEDDWRFTTPQGRFQVQYKERNPVWIAPDWFFVENGLPVPPPNDPSRYMKGTLGAAAVYIAPDLAIHGTDRPELIGQRVSHGCIRLENRYALRLYNAAQIGTEVIIIGGEHVERNGKVVDLRDGYDESLRAGSRKPPPPPDPVYTAWSKLDTEELIELLDEQLTESETGSRWDQIAGLLLDRIREGDEDAMDGLFSRSAGLPTLRIEREYSTYLAEAYRTETVEALESLASMRIRDRMQAAEMIVAAMVTLYNGDYDTPSVPWPSARIPESLITRRARRGWSALISAEDSHRERVLGGETSPLEI